MASNHLQHKCTFPAHLSGAQAWREGVEELACIHCTRDHHVCGHGIGVLLAQALQQQRDVSDCVCVCACVCDGLLTCVLKAEVTSVSIIETFEIILN